MRALIKYMQKGWATRHVLFSMHTPISLRNCFHWSWLILVCILSITQDQVFVIDSKCESGKGRCSFNPSVNTVSVMISEYAGMGGTRLAGNADKLTQHAGTVVGDCRADTAWLSHWRNVESYRLRNSMSHFEEF